MDKKYYMHIGVDSAYEDYKTDIGMREAVQEVYNNIECSMRKPDLLGKTLHVTANQFPVVFEIVNNIAQKLNMEIPKVYVFEDFFYGVESYGMGEYWIEISAKTVRDFTKKELEFLFARELYKIKEGVTYHIMLMEQMQKIYATIPAMGELVSKTSKNKFNHWCRLENFTADNFAYLYCQDIKAGVNAIIALVLNSKELLEQVDMKAFIKQASSINRLDDVVSNYTKVDENLPYAPFRVESLLAYAMSKRGMQARKEMQ